MKRSNQYTLKAPISKRRRASRETPEQQALRLVSRDLSLMRTAGRTEQKCTQYSSTGASVTSTGTIYNLQFNMGQGSSGFNDFVGNEVLPTSIRVKYTLSMGPNLALAADPYNVIRLIVFQYDSAGAPGVGGVIATLEPLSDLLWSNRPILHILSDQLVTLTTPDPLVAFDAKSDKIYIKGKKIRPISFSNSGASIQKNGIYMLAISDSNATPHPSLTFKSQITYTDS